MQMRKNLFENKKLINNDSIDQSLLNKLKPSIFLINIFLSN